MKILIMGLPGSGKTTLASKLTQIMNARWINADEVRKKFNDWDFSRQGVLRQAKRMGDLADSSQEKIIIADFICPYEDGRKLFNPDYIIWMDTIQKGRVPTFDRDFEKPKNYNFRVKDNKDNTGIENKIIEDIKNFLNNK